MGVKSNHQNTQYMASFTLMEAQHTRATATVQSAYEVSKSLSTPSSIAPSSSPPLPSENPPVPQPTAAPLPKTKRLPLFVYGTLVPHQGFHNFEQTLASRVTLFPPGRQWFWNKYSKNTTFVVAHANDWNIFHLAGFPGVKRGSGTVIGALVWPHDENGQDYESTLREADALEKFYGVNSTENEYERVEIEAFVPATGETHQAWMYACLLDMTSALRVDHGNWPKFMKENNLKDAAGDWSDKYHSTAAADLKT